MNIYHLIPEKLPLDGVEILCEEQPGEKDAGTVHRERACTLLGAK